MSSEKELDNKIIRFCKERGWSPKSADIAKSIVIEAAELLEHFQWDESGKSVNGMTPKDWGEIGEEVADVYWYLILFCDSANIDLGKVVEDKLKKNEKKFPKKKFAQGHNDKFYKEQKRRYRKRKK